MQKEEHLTWKLKKINKRLRNSSEIIAENIANQVGLRINLDRENSLLNKISTVEIEKDKLVTKKLTAYKKNGFYLTSLEEDFIHYIIKNINIDLSKE